MVQLKHLLTEQRNAASAHIDEMSTLEMVQLINAEDQKVPQAVAREAQHIADAIDLIYDKMRVGGRLIYCGAGTSGRLGILDAVECPPTYSTEPEQVQGLIAGGERAIFRAVEGAEDDPESGRADLESIGFSQRDVLVGVAASGRTPYVIGAMDYARGLGAATVSVTCCPGCPMEAHADVCIAPTPGPEVVTGSTRMKSGTAQKLVLNLLSTCTMIRMGKVYGNLMVDVKPSNEKLVCRCVSIVCMATDCDEAQAREALEQCAYSPKVAIVMLLRRCDAARAKHLLDCGENRIVKALACAEE